MMKILCHFLLLELRFYDVIEHLALLGYVVYLQGSLSRCVHYGV
jgi:hypothetical protein